MEASGRAATPIAFVRTVALAYQRRGLDPSAALQRALIAPAALHDIDARITARQMELFCEAAMRELDDEALGWFSRRLPWGSYGMLYRASLGSPTLRVALKRWCRHHRLLVDDVLLRIEESDGRATLLIEEARPLDPAMRDFCLLTLLRYVHGYACWLVDSRIPLLAVDFAHAAPRHHRTYQAMFPGPVRFDAGFTGIGFPVDDLTLPPRRDEAALQAMLARALPLTVLQYRHDRLVVQRVRHLLPRFKTAEALAGQLHRSVRTLHRQLAQQGTSLQTLKDEVHRERAIEALTRSSRSIKQVARDAGFDNQKSFSRAFRRWTGTTPTALREAGRAASRRPRRLSAGDGQP